MSREVYDVIVVGLGGVGSAAVYHLAKRGVRVLGIDQFSPPHTRGSSHGQTRVIRQAYFEHHEYVPLLKQAYDLWDQLESESGVSLFRRTGLLQFGPSDGVVIPGVLRSANEHQLSVEQMTAREAEIRFPGLRAEEAWSAVFERNAGYLMVERCVEAHLQQAKANGAELRVDEAVVDWQSDRDGVIVRTDQETLRSDKLVLAGGPWATRWLREVNVSLTVLRKHLYWFDASPAIYGEEAGFPCYFVEAQTGCFYGTPIRDNLGLKVACHSGGEPVLSVDGDSHVDDDSDRRAVEGFLARHMPQATNVMRRADGCYYTMTADENFIVDRMPESDRVTMIAGLSGHGFKFTSVLGEIASKLALGENAGMNVDFLRLDRLMN